MLCYFYMENFNWVKILNCHVISFMSNCCLDSLGLLYFSLGQLSLFFPNPCDTCLRNLKTDKTNEHPPPIHTYLGSFSFSGWKQHMRRTQNIGLALGKQRLQSVFLGHYPLFCISTVTHTTIPQDWRDVVYSCGYGMNVVTGRVYKETEFLLCHICFRFCKVNYYNVLMG